MTILYTRYHKWYDFVGLCLAFRHMDRLLIKADDPGACRLDASLGIGESVNVCFKIRRRLHCRKEFLVRKSTVIMRNKLLKSFTAGFVATAAMTIVGVMLPYLNLPRMNPAEMLSTMLNIHQSLGWVIHALIGELFALVYAYWFNSEVIISNKFWKGVLFGLTVFLFAQIALLILSVLIPSSGDPDEPSLLPTIIASLLTHLVYGVFVAWIMPARLQSESA